MRLNELPAPPGAVHKTKRLGRGESSGRGKTSGRGNKGQKARAGGFHKVGFEGGQMPLTRRIPKRGFRSLNREEFAVAHVGDLADFAPNSEVTTQTLAEMGLVKLSQKRRKVKILGDGDLTHPLVVKVDRFSGSAKEKIEKAGGQAIVSKL